MLSRMERFYMRSEKAHHHELHQYRACSAGNRAPEKSHRDRDVTPEGQPHADQKSGQSSQDHESPQQNRELIRKHKDSQNC